MTNSVTELAEILIDVMPRLIAVTGTPWAKIAVEVINALVHFPQIVSSFEGDTAEKNLGKLESAILIAMQQMATTSQQQAASSEQVDSVPAT